MRKGIITAAGLVAAGLAFAADEITVNASLQVANGYLSDTRRVTNLQVDQSDASSAAGVQIVSTNEAAVAYGDLVTPGWAIFRNISENTNGVTITLGVVDASTNFIAVAEMDNGETAMFRVGASVALWVKSSVEGEKMDRLILED